MTDGLEINECDFKRYNVKEQNVVIFKNLLDIKTNLINFERSNTKEHKNIKNVSWRALLLSSGALGLTVILLGFLFQHISH
jgi:hypothetical protein